MGRSRDKWHNISRKVKNKEALPPDVIRFIWHRYCCGQSSETIYKSLKEERQISASLVTIVGYVEKEVKPYCYEEHRKQAELRKKRHENIARVLRKIERSEGEEVKKMYESTWCRL